jgi:hypothetical protein
VNLKLFSWYLITQRWNAPAEQAVDSLQLTWIEEVRVHAVHPKIRVILHGSKAAYY